MPGRPASDGPHATPRPQGLSLEWKIPLVITAVLAMGLAAMLIVTYHTISRRAAGIVRDRLTHAVQEVASTVRPGMAPRVAAIHGLADREEVRRALGRRPVPLEDRAAATRLLEAMRTPEDTGFTAELWDLRGRAVVAVGRRRTGTNRPPGPVRGTAVARDSTWFGPIAPAGARSRFWMAAPVHYGGQQVGWVALLRRVGGPAEASRMLREFMREDVSLYIHNRDGTGWVGAPDQPLPAPLSRDSTSEGLFYQRPGIGLTAVSEVAVPGTPWVMALEVPQASIIARPRRTLKLLLQLSFGLLVGGALLSWWVGRQITRPIRALTAAAEEVARGGFPGAVSAGGDEIGRLATSFDSMTRQVEAARRILEQRAQDAEEANRSKTQFLRAMSHELRTPLNAIGGYAQLLEMGLHGPVTEEQREVLMRISTSQAHLLSLIEDLLSFAQLEAGRLRFEVEEVPLADTVAELEGIVEPHAAARRVRVGFVSSPEAVARADRDKVRQVALNLVVNAIKFTPEGGEVAVECEADTDRVSLRVRDTGIGIPSEQLERIFEPFVQGDRAPNRAAEGVGLGLAISRELARGMGGEVTVASAPGVGSTFTLVLPRADEA